MLFYILIYAIILLIYFLLKEKSTIPICIILCLLVCCRAMSVGTDTVGYIRLMQEGYYNIGIKDVVNWFQTGNYFKDSYFGSGALREFSFSFYISFLYSLFNNSAVVLNFTVCLILCLYLVAFKKKCSQNVALCLIIYISIYLFYSSFNTIRQSLATIVLVLGVLNVYQKNYLLAVVLLLLSGSIHASVVAILPIIILCFFIKLNKKFALGILCLLLIIFVLQIPLPIVNQIIPDNFGGRNYEQGLVDEAGAVFNVYIHYISFIFQAIMIFVFNWFFVRAKGKFSIFYNFWFIGIVLYLLLMKSPNIGRISEFFMVFQIFAIVLTLNEIKKGKQSQYKYSQYILFIYCIFWYSFYALRNWYGIQPYLLG